MLHKTLHLCTLAVVDGAIQLEGRGHMCISYYCGVVLVGRRFSKEMTDSTGHQHVFDAARPLLNTRNRRGVGFTSPGRAEPLFGLGMITNKFMVLLLFFF